LYPHTYIAYSDKISHDELNYSFSLTQRGQTSEMFLKITINKNYIYIYHYKKSSFFNKDNFTPEQRKILNYAYAFKKIINKQWVTSFELRNEICKVAD